MSMQYPGEDFLLTPGDLLTVRVYGEMEYTPIVRIGLDGTVLLPYIGSLSLQGLTIRSAQTLIADRLRTGGFYTHPEVSILVMESLNGTVTVAGEVRSLVPVTGARRLIEVISAAGGLPANASHTVRITRPGVDHPIVINLGADLSNSENADTPVYPRDIIQISRAGVVYTLGAFGHQGATPLDQATPLTLMQLTALSGGIGFEGRYADLRIIRTVGTERKVVEVDVKKVIHGQAPDPILEANDIVYLPSNATKAVLKSLGIGGVIGILSLAVSLRGY